MPKPQNFVPVTRALPHQVEAIEFIANREWSALFDEQGLGKTKVIIDALSQMMRDRVIDSALVVAPLTLLFNWEDEVRKHSHLVPIVVRGSRGQRKYQLLTGANFYIANYDALVGGREVFQRLVRSRKMAIALDESTRIKDPATATAQALHAVGAYADRRIIMTGTPIANRPQDLWSQFYFLDGGDTLGDDYSAFARRFEPGSETFTTELDELSETVRQCSIRRLKDETLELPDKVVRVVPVQLVGEQAEAYRRCADELIVEVRPLTGAKYIKEVEGILEKLLRLVQLASSPALLDARYVGPNAKYDELDDLIPSLLETHEKVILWSSFVQNVEALAARYSVYGTGFIHGGVGLDERAALVRAFQSEDRPRILVANPAAAREGLTLTRASAAVYMDRNFSLVDYLQSQDRIHRIGQTRQCEIIKLVAEGTVDEYVDVLIELKSTIADYVYRPTNERETSVVSLLEEKGLLLRVLGGTAE